MIYFHILWIYGTLSVFCHVGHPFFLFVKSFLPDSSSAHQLKLPQSELRTCRFSLGLFLRTACPGNHRSDRICQYADLLSTPISHKKKLDLESDDLKISERHLYPCYTVWSLGQFLPNKWDKQRNACKSCISSSFLLLKASPQYHGKALRLYPGSSEGRR